MTINHTLTVIIPVYNEQDNLERVQKEMQAYIDIALVPTQVLFVNDGSKDNSQQMIERICCSNTAFHYISLDKNYGLSAALKAGFDTVRTSLTGYMDADLQTTPQDFNVLLKHIENNDLVTGQRTSRKDSFVKNTSSKIANGIRRAFTRDGMDDTGCPLKIIKTEYAQRIPMFRGLHRFLPAMVLLQNGHIKQIPVSHFERIAGRGNFGVWNRLIGPLVDCFAYLWMKKNYINYEIRKQG